MIQRSGSNSTVSSLNSQNLDNGYVSDSDSEHSYSSQFSEHSLDLTVVGVHLAASAVAAPAPVDTQSPRLNLPRTTLAATAPTTPDAENLRLARLLAPCVNALRARHSNALSATVACYSLFHLLRPNAQGLALALRADHAGTERTIRGLLAQFPDNEQLRAVGWSIIVILENARARVADAGAE